MSKKSELNARHYLFLLKLSACFAALILGSFLLAPKARMQDDAVMTGGNVSVVVNNNSYRPMPEPLKSTVRGRVFYEDTGRAVKRTSIILMGKNGGREVSGLTDNNGNFTIKNVVAGTYYAFVNAPGVISPLAYADFTKPKNGGLEQAVESFPAIVVSGAGDVNVEIPARRGGAISGRVMYADGDAAIGIKVEILRKAGETFLPVIPNFSNIFSMMSGGGGGFQTDDRGVFRFSGLPNGEYIVKVTENVAHGNSVSRGYRGIEETLFGGGSLLTLFYPDALTTEKAQAVNVVAGQEMSEINLYIPERELFNVEGRIINAKDRSPIKNATLSLKKTGEDTVSLFNDFGKKQQSSQSDEQGGWNFSELPKGTYTLTIEPSNYYYDADGYMSNSNSYRASNVPPKPKLAKKTQEITIDNQSLSEIVIELGYGATVSGTVKTENNQTMPQTVTINAVQDDSEASSSATVYNSSYAGNSAYAGNYAVISNSASSSPRKPEHDFKLEAVAAGKTFLWATVNNDDDFYVKSAIFNGVDLLTNPIELKEGDVLRNVQFVISKGAGTLKGTVLDGDKQPAKNVWILLLPVEALKRKNPNFKRSATTGENGEFEVKAAPGEYAIIFSTKELGLSKGAKLDSQFDEAVKTAPKATIKANETEKISLIMPK